MFFFIILAMVFPSLAGAEYLTGAEQLKSVGAEFSWRDVESNSVKISLEYSDGNTKKRLQLGSGFLISPSGLFITAYHVMTYCLQARRESSRFDDRIDCSTAHPRARYFAQNRDREYEIEVLSHLNETDSTSGKSSHTPDEIMSSATSSSLGSKPTPACVSLFGSSRTSSRATSICIVRGPILSSSRCSRRRRYLLPVIHNKGSFASAMDS